MKKFLSAMAIAFFSIGAFAQTGFTGSAQSAQTQATNSAASIQSGAVDINSTSYGAERLRTSQQAPSIGFNSSFSPDNCASIVGGSVGTFGFGGGAGVAVDKDSCVMLRTYERLQQGAASEAADRTTTYVDDNGVTQTVSMRAALKDSAYEVLAEISPKVRGILSRRGVIHGQAAVAYDKSGTTGLQPASTRVEEKPSLIR